MVGAPMVYGLSPVVLQYVRFVQALIGFRRFGSYAGGKNVTSLHSSAMLPLYALALPSLIGSEDWGGGRGSKVVLDIELGDWHHGWMESSGRFPLWRGDCRYGWQDLDGLFVLAPGALGRSLEQRQGRAGQMSLMLFCLSFRLAVRERLLPGCAEPGR